MSSFLNDIEQHSPDAVRRLFRTQESPNTAGIPPTVSVRPAAAEEEADPRTPPPANHDGHEDRRRLGDLEKEVEAYRGILEDVQGHMAAQQAAHDDALASSQAQITQLLAALAATSAQAAVSSPQPAAQTNTNPPAAAAADAQCNNGDLYLFPGSQQGDCSAADTGRSVRQDTTAAAQTLDADASTAHTLAAAAATAKNNAGSQQGDCPPADAGSSVRRDGNNTDAHACNGDSAAPAQQDPPAAASDGHALNNQPMFSEQGDQPLRHSFSAE